MRRARGASRGIADEYHAAVCAPQVVLEVMTHPSAATHTGTADAPDGHGVGGLAAEAQAMKGKGIIAIGIQLSGIRIMAFGVTAKDFGGGYGHGGVEKHLH